jgi:hypothetical protein
MPRLIFIVSVPMALNLGCTSHMEDARSNTSRSKMDSDKPTASAGYFERSEQRDGHTSEPRLPSATEIHGKNVRASLEPCVITWTCPKGEECLGTDDQKTCRPATLGDCKSWWRCRRDGFCTLINGRCLLGVDSDEDCKKTYGEGFNPCEAGMCRALHGDCYE